MGKWLTANGEAIYGTVPVEPFQEGRIAYTARGPGTIYAIYMPDKNETALPETLTIRTNQTGKLSVVLLSVQKKLKSKMTQDGLVVTIPHSMRAALAHQESVVVKIAMER